MGTDAIGNLIAGFAAIVSVCAMFITLTAQRKEWRLISITHNRLEWAENLRKTLAILVQACYDGADIRAARDQVALYLNPENDSHKQLLRKMDDLTTSEDKIAEVKELVLIAQVLLRENWWIVKIEAGEDPIYAKIRKKKLEEHSQYHEKSR